MVDSPLAYEYVLAFTDTQLSELNMRQQLLVKEALDIFKEYPKLYNILRCRLLHDKIIWPEQLSLTDNLNKRKLDNSQLLSVDDNL